MKPVTEVVGVLRMDQEARSGDVCEGDGMGGHEPLEPLIDLSGTLTRS